MKHKTSHTIAPKRGFTFPRNLFTIMIMEKRSCPHCQREMVFAPDGRSLLCERCGYKQPIQRPHRTAKQLSRDLRFKGSHLGPTTPDGPTRTTNVRDLLERGVAAAKNNQPDEAHFYLEWVLNSDSSEAERARAWWWLSQVYNDPADKRECLEQVLAIRPNDPEARRGMAILDGRLDPQELVDPNQLTPETADALPRAAQTQKFTCPQCAGAMNYAPDGQSLRCDFCGYQHPLAETAETVVEEFGIGEFEQDFIAALSTAKGHMQPVTMRAFQCHSCAVEFVLAPETLSVTCPYCDSVYVTKTAETRQLLPPQALIPFALDETEIKKRLRAWFKENDLERPKVTPLVGIYLPVWTFDASGEVKWGGYVKQGDTWVHRSGTHYELVDDFRVPASQKLPTNLSHILDSFSYTHLVAYDSRYLADWPAERYQVSLADASLVARKGMVQGLRKRPYRLVGDEDVHDLKINTSGLSIQSFKLLLLPLWVVHYKLEGETIYTVLLNGQTGTVQGEKPQTPVGKFFSWLRGK